MPRIELIPERSFIKKWFLFSLLAAIAIPFLFFPEGYMSLEGLKKVYDDMIYSFFISLGISFSVGMIEQNLNRLMPWIEAPLKRLIVEVLAVTIFGFASIFTVSFLFYWSFGVFTLSDIPWGRVLRQTKEPMIIGYIITAFFISRSFLMQWRDAAVNNQTLRAERYKGQVRLLKDQLNPHFLFNSFNVLIDVVYENQDEAAEYIRELSKFYRHILEVQDEELVPLTDELDFAVRYFALQQKRFGATVELKEELGPITDEFIPPLVLQLLIENAIKHNVPDPDKPLVIELIDNEQYLIIRNNRVTKLVVESSTGIGLENIKKRYELLSDKEVIVTASEDSFAVQLPRLFSQKD